MLQDISYKDYKRSNDIHGTVLYPAVMVAPVQKDVLTDIAMQDGEINSILDPFCGSGTALYESHLVFPDARLYGCDINPLANLITKVKLAGVSADIKQSIDNVKAYIDRDTSSDIYEFPNREKWFRDDIASSLSKLRRAIIQINDKQDRLFFWCMMSDIVRRYSNSRSSTYKLHKKPQERIDAMQDNAVQDFKNSIAKNSARYQEVHCDDFTLYKDDLLECLPQFRDHKVDLLITSPPYGDNNTTVPYGLFSSLALKWIDPNDLELDGWELNSYSAIDNHSLGNGRTPASLSDIQEELLSSYLEKIADDKKSKVRRFFHGYFACLDLFTEITEKYIVLTLGNRTVDRVKIDLAKISQQYLQTRGFTEYLTASRDILNKRTPSLTSRVHDEPVASMCKEYVLIYQKQAGAMASRI